MWQPALGGEQHQAMRDGFGLGACLWHREKPTPSLWIYLRNGKVPAGHGNISCYAPIVLGEVRLPGAAKPRISVASADRVHQVYELAAKGSGAGAGVQITVSRLTPALLFDLSGTTSVALFAGDKTKTRRLLRWGNFRWIQAQKQRGFKYFFPDRRKHVQFSKELRKQLGEPRPPRFFALSDGRSVRLGTLSKKETVLGRDGTGWVLLWYGKDAWFATGESTMVPTAPPVHLGPGDAPMLLLFSQAPTAKLTGRDGLGPGGSLVLTFPRPGAKMALLPLYGYRIPPVIASAREAHEETQAWSDALPGEVKQRCDWWASRLAEYPVTVEETLSYDAGSDTTVMKEVFSFSRIREGGVRAAPVPPMLELARREGFPIKTSAEAVDSGMATYCGPYAVVEGADRYEVRIRGLGKYARETPVPKPAAARAGTGVPAVQAELVSEVDKILAAGHLAPVMLPWKHAWGWSAPYYSCTVRQLYFAPGQVLYTLSAALPFLDRNRRDRVLEYLQNERAQFPPEVVPHLPSDKGSRREAVRVPAFWVEKQTALLRGRNFHIVNKIVPGEALYDLASYYAARGAEEMEEDGFDLAGAVQTTALPWLSRTEWATLGWYSWDRKDHDYGLNRTVEANRQAAGLIGLVRLARVAGEKAWEGRAMAHLGRVLAHRYALGKYLGWLYRRGGVLIVPEGFDPSADVREVTISERTVFLGYGRNTGGLLPRRSDFEGAYKCMVPETGRFFADHLKAEAEAFARETATFYGDAFMTLGTPRRVTEWWHNNPTDPHQIFLIHAWILGRDGDWLRRHLDVPLVPVGDWYHIDKLVATLRDYSGTRWEVWR